MLHSFIPFFLLNMKARIEIEMKERPSQETVTLCTNPIPVLLANGKIYNGLTYRDKARAQRGQNRPLQKHVAKKRNEKISKDIPRSSSKGLLAGIAHVTLYDQKLLTREKIAQCSVE